MTHNVVIVGAGLAAANAVETLREEGYDGSIVLIGEESRLPYERPQLSKDVLKGSEFAQLHDEQWYDDRRVDVRLSTSVTRLDLAGGTVELSTGESLPFEALLLATGARPRVVDLPGIEKALTLRTAEDALHLKDELRPGRRIVLVGGGWIGLEVAAAAAESGCHVTILEVAALPLGNVLGPDIASALVELHRSHGVEIRTGVKVTAIEDDGVRLGDDLVPADLVIASVGAVPNTELAEQAGLRVDNGIVVDERLRTSDPRVYAAGDAALATHTTWGPLRVEHWDNAIRQGQLAARSILGQDAVYDWAPYFFTDQFEFSMEYVGHSAPSDRVIIRGDLAGREYVAYWLDDTNTVTAGMNVNVWDVNDRLREQVGRQVDPEELPDLRGDQP